jgi:hypothetical protein
MAKKWHSKTWKMKGDSWHGAMAGYVDPGEFADDILHGGDYTSLFVYMFRRFGISEYGSDSYKEIACWYLTTPDPDVVLAVSPRPSGLRYSFGYQINTKAYDEFDRDNESQIGKVNSALKEAMKDLLTSTNIRDVYINAVGRVKDDLIKTTIEYSEWAGFGVTSDYYKKFNEKPDNK